MTIELTAEQADVMLKLLKKGARVAGREAWRRNYKDQDLTNAIAFNQRVAPVVASVVAQIALQR